MADYEQCPQCKRWVSLFAHVCPPKWRVWCEDDGDESDAVDVYEATAGEAAEAYAEKWDESDGDGGCSILRGEPVVFVVNGVRFDMTGEACPQYYAHEIKETDDGG